MFRTYEKRRRQRIALEPLETRELLSGSRLKQAIISAGATPEAPVSITLHLSRSSAPAGDYVDVASKHVLLTGQTAPGETVVLRKTLAAGKLRKVAQTHADAQGVYRFAINCGMGTTSVHGPGRRSDGCREQLRPARNSSEPGNRLELGRSAGGPKRGHTSA